jgi:hypothetical protein
MSTAESLAGRPHGYALRRLKLVGQREGPVVPPVGRGRMLAVVTNPVKPEEGGFGRRTC